MDPNALIRLALRLPPAVGQLVESYFGRGTGVAAAVYVSENH